MDRAFSASRYDEESPGDYLNCPMSEEEYTAFYQALVSADRMPPREFEEARFFEGCLPVEAMADRGPQTLAFGPMKPVGLNDPRTGRRPYAVVQLRRENRAGTLYNLVGFQTRLKQGEQKRILAMIPGLENARIVRYGCMHRNTFINAPRHINQYLQFDEAPGILAAGQVSGVEGYVESAAMGILAGENAARLALGRPPVTPPPTTALGGLVGRLTDRTTRNFQPSNVNFGMLPPAPKKIGKKNRPAFYTERALADLEKWLGEVDGD
jgi:methylenetetrahydrofolate--tRNA-(uracil-5-)-methyltransferase